MSTSLDHIHRGLVRAFERQRAKVKTRQQATQIVQKTNDSNDTFSTSATLSDEQYRTAIIEAAATHIRQKKEKL